MKMKHIWNHHLGPRNLHQLIRTCGKRSETCSFPILGERPTTKWLENLHHSSQLLFFVNMSKVNYFVRLFFVCGFLLCETTQIIYIYMYIYINIQIYSWFNSHTAILGPCCLPAPAGKSFRASPAALQIALHATWWEPRTHSSLSPPPQPCQCPLGCRFLPPLVWQCPWSKLPGSLASCSLQIPPAVLELAVLVVYPHHFGSIGGLQPPQTHSVRCLDMQVLQADA